MKGTRSGPVTPNAEDYFAPTAADSRAGRHRRFVGAYPRPQRSRDAERRLLIQALGGGPTAGGYYAAALLLSGAVARRDAIASSELDDSEWRDFRC